MEKKAFKGKFCPKYGNFTVLQLKAQVWCNINLKRVFVCEKNREGKSSLKMKAGGERNQINARIYAPAESTIYE